MEITKQPYEIVMIFSVEGGEDSAKALVSRFQKLIEDNATIDNVEEWGRRRLAYPINDETDGYYLLVNFTADTDFPMELDRVLSITDGVLRSMVIRLEEPVVVKQADDAETE